MNNRIILILLLAVIPWVVSAQVNITYQEPPGVMKDIVDAPPTPSSWISPDGQWMLILGQPSLPSIEEVSQPELRIAGLRINPVTNGPSRSRYYNSIGIISLVDLNESGVSGLPENPRITDLSWSPDMKKIAFVNTVSDGIELWVLEIGSGNARILTKPVLNMIFRSDPYQWSGDSKSIYFMSVLPDRGNSPEASSVPEGPVVSENIGKSSPVRTYQDLLKNKDDEDLLEYYGSSEIMQVDLDGKITATGNKGMITDLFISPDGNYFLVEKVKKPFSYIVPYYNFSQTVEIWNNDGAHVKTLADLPLADDIPTGFGSVRKGPRNFYWRSDAPAEVYWIEALDEGDASKEADYRDQVYALGAPFNSEPVPVLKTSLRFAGLSWGNGNTAMVYERWRRSRQLILSRFSPDNPEKEKKLLWDRSTEDVYTDPGSFVQENNEYGRSVLMMEDDGKTLYLRGYGASPEGDRPFVDSYDLDNKKTNRIWQSMAPYYEYPVFLLDPSSGVLITRRESVTEQPNYFIRNVKKDKLEQITKFKHPHPELSKIKKQFLTYFREDGVLLTGTLYLPYQEDEKNRDLPVLMWAYPREYKSAAAAAQVDDSPYRFDRISYSSTLIWLTQGYAVMNGAKMPIIGEGDEEPNNTFVKQLVSSAEAAIDTLVEMGVADRDKIAIGGHSYGAFMTANLLAHSDLFAAGIARSGAYNRTLTPFGFQAEERTFWEAPDIYFAMSPFMHADKVNEPILLIHGEADNNSGTFPIQSKRYYHALKGHGATVRLVMLPHESHGYRARESVMHMLWETNEWMRMYVKGEM